MIEYEFNEELKILEVAFIGAIDLKELIRYGEMIRNDSSLPRDLRILTNATTAIYHLSADDVTEMMVVLKDQIKPYRFVKTAVLQEKPVETAISMLVDTREPIHNYEHKVFSTRQAALKWLNE